MGLLSTLLQPFWVNLMCEPDMDFVWENFDHKQQKSCPTSCRQSYELKVGGSDPRLTARDLTKLPSAWFSY